MAYLLICPYLQGRMSKLLAIAAFLYLPVALARAHLLVPDNVWCWYSSNISSSIFICCPSNYCSFVSCCGVVWFRAIRKLITYMKVKEHYYSTKPAIIQLLLPACDIIAERETKERSEDHQLPSPATWARQIPLGSMVLGSFPHQACCLELRVRKQIFSSK